MIAPIPLRNGDGLLARSRWSGWRLLALIGNLARSALRLLSVGGSCPSRSDASQPVVATAGAGWLFHETCRCRTR